MLQRILIILVVCVPLIKGVDAQNEKASSLFINRGAFTSMDTVNLPALFFNKTATFTPQNSVLRAKVGETISLSITNNDTEIHDILVDGHSVTDVNPSSTSSLPLRFNKEGIYTIKDASSDFTYLGLSTYIVVSNNPYKNFYWILNEHQIDWIEAFELHSKVDTTMYHPEYFTINHLSFPATQMDSLGTIKGMVGDTLRLNMYNAGRMNHNIHLHGFHARILSSSEFPYQEGREKDSFAINTGESLMLEIVAFQEGMYPIHNHNLGATLGNGLYPKGMVSTIMIAK